MCYENNKKSIKDYLIKERIGVGSYGLVFKVTKKNERNLFVLKQIPYISKDNKKQIADIQNEAKLLSLIDSKFVVKYYDSFEENNNIDIVMEYCEGGDLSSYLLNAQKLSKALSEDRIWKFFIQMSLGLEYLHNKKILHRDLKSMNIFLTKALDVKIGDLGVAKLLQNTSHAHTFIGTPFYLSPEVCEEKPYNDKSDVWALGCITYEMLTFKHPYEATNHAALFLKIINGKYEPVSSKYSEDLRKLIDLLLEKNHIKRPSMSQIIKMPIFISKAKQFGLLEYVVDSLENHNRANRGSIDTRKTPVKLVNKMGISSSHLANNNQSNIATNSNNSSSNINTNSNNQKERFTTDGFGKKKHHQSQQRVKTNMIDYNYLKYKEQAQIKKMVLNSNSNNKKSQLSQGKDNNNKMNHIPHQKPSPNRINLITASQNSNKKSKQWSAYDIESSKLMISPSIHDNNSTNIHNEEDTSYKNRYMMSKRSNVSETKHSSINTSVNTSRKETYHGIVQNDPKISNIRVKRDSNLDKNYSNASSNQKHYNNNNDRQGNIMKFNPGDELNEFIKELNLKSSSSVLQCQDSSVQSSFLISTQPDTIISKPKSNIKVQSQHTNNNKIEDIKAPLWNDSTQNDGNCEFEVIEANDHIIQKAQRTSNGYNDNSFEDGECNYHHNPDMSDDENENDNEEETVSMLKSTTNFPDVKQELEKENHELINYRGEYKQIKDKYFDQIAQYSSMIDLPKIFKLYKQIENDITQIDDIHLRINEYIKECFPKEEKAKEFSDLFFKCNLYEFKLNNIDKLLNERKNMI